MVERIKVHTTRRLCAQLSPRGHSRSTSLVNRALALDAGVVGIGHLPFIHHDPAAKAAVSRAERQLNYAHLHGFEQPVEANVVPRIEREKALQRTLIAEKDLVETQRRLIALLSGAGPESVDATQAQTRLENPRLSITSPATGVIATSSRQLKGMRGELVRKGDLIARVYNLRKIAAEISIP